MIEFIFVAVICTGGTNCDFITSNVPITEKHCQQIKYDFLHMPFKKEVTLAAAQCMNINTGEKV